MTVKLIAVPLTDEGRTENNYQFICRPLNEPLPATQHTGVHLMLTHNKEC